MKWLITGGAGFIGCNAARRLLEAGHEVMVADDLSRGGSVSNLTWLRTYGHFEFVRMDVRDRRTVSTALEHAKADVVLHLAAQVAVTTSVANPRLDFEVNALGTFNVLEALRSETPEAILINASTNKVYGGQEHLAIVEREGRHLYDGKPHGISEKAPVDFHSPYGCSKGAADQYVVDYHRIYGLRTVNVRQSCIYGKRQFGVEDQGWLAWFAIAMAQGKTITIYGDGKQVRDLLHVNDLVDLYLTAVDRIDSVSGQTFNAGGGPRNAVSLLEALDALGETAGRQAKIVHADWRPGDQRVFVSDIRKAKRELGWRPKVSVKQGVQELMAWVLEHANLFQRAA